jgi:hypothetical protein
LNALKQNRKKRIYKMENKDPKYSAKKKREKKSKSASLLVAN